MATIFPDSRKTKVIFASKAEENFYVAARTLLPDPWRVYYSVILTTVEDSSPSSGGQTDAEIDFILYHPKLGIIVLEVKGGRIGFSAEKNSFYSVNRYDKVFTIRNPFEQALQFKARLIRYLKVHKIKAPITHAVCFPSVKSSDVPMTSSQDKNFLIGSEELRNLPVFLESMVRTGQPEHFMDFPDRAQKLDELFYGKDFCTRLYLRDYISSQESRVMDLGNFFASFIAPFSEMDRLGIEGEAGTGKTLLATALAEHFTRNQKRVLFLSSNPILQDRIADGFPAQLKRNIQFRTYIEAAKDCEVDLMRVSTEYRDKNLKETASVKESQAQDEKLRANWMQVEAPSLWQQQIRSKKIFFDVLICDEGQDVQPFWWDALQQYLNQGKLYIFFDRGQGVFGSGSREKIFQPESILPVPRPYFPLVNNYRTTREIAQFAKRFRPQRETFSSHSARSGYLPEVVSYKDKADAMSKLRTLIRVLINQEGIQPEDICIVSARKPQLPPSILEGVTSIDDTPLFYLQGKRSSKPKHVHEKKGAIHVSSIAGFKGMEAKIIIAINLSEYRMKIENPIMSSLFYVAFTRAKHMLYAFCQQNDPKFALLCEVRQNISYSGTLNLEEVAEVTNEEVNKKIRGKGRFLGRLPGGLGVVSDQKKLIYIPATAHNLLSELIPGDEVIYEADYYEDFAWVATKVESAASRKF